MRTGLFSPRALDELDRAADWIAGDNPPAAEALLDAAVKAAALLASKPQMAHVRPELAPARYRFWPLRGYPYLLVLDAEHDPPVVARFVHQARDLPALLSDLDT